MANPIQEFESLLSTSNFLFVVYFRGHWCPFCISYLKKLSTLQPKISAAGGQTVVVTSELPEKLAATRTSTGYDGPAIVDTKNVLVTELKKRGWIDVAISEKKGYANGMAQPAVLVVNKDGDVLYKWAIAPAMMNLNGAKDRPDLYQIWDNVDAKMHGMKEVHQKYKLQTFTGVMLGKVFG